MFFRLPWNAKRHCKLLLLKLSLILFLQRGDSGSNHNLINSIPAWVPAQSGSSVVCAGQRWEQFDNLYFRLLAHPEFGSSVPLFLWGLLQLIGFSLKVRQLFNNPNHRKLLARLLVQDVDNIPTRYLASSLQISSRYIYSLNWHCYLKNIWQFEKYLTILLKIFLCQVVPGVHGEDPDCEWISGVCV